VCCVQCSVRLESSGMCVVCSAERDWSLAVCVLCAVQCETGV